VALVEAAAMVPIGTPIRDYGVINFVRNRREAKADFLRVQDGAKVNHLLRFLTKQWRLPDPGIIVQITGSAQNFDLPPNLVTPITEGIVAAASVAEAWVITGGFDAGVMSLIGSSVARWRHKCDKTPLLGVGAWRGVQNNHLLENACGNRVNYYSAGRNTRRAAGLEPNHTHFLLVDPPSSKPEDPSFGTEQQLLEELQRELRRVYGAPTVLLVIQGGPGTLDTMLRALRNGIVTVLAADSGQVRVCVCVSVRERGRARGRLGAGTCVRVRACACACVRACVCVREREAIGEAGGRPCLWPLLTITPDHRCLWPHLTIGSLVAAFCRWRRRWRISFAPVRWRRTTPSSRTSFTRSARSTSRARRRTSSRARLMTSGRW